MVAVALADSALLILLNSLLPRAAHIYSSSLAKLQILGIEFPFLLLRRLDP
jgi:hypothetical protein